MIPVAQSVPPKSIHVLDLPSLLRRHLLRFCLTSLIVASTAFLASLLVTPVYESEASFRVRMSSEAGLGSSLLSGIGDVAEALPGGLAAAGGLGETDVQTEIGILRSRAMLEPVADELALHVQLSRPWRVFRSDIFSLVEAGEDAPKGTYTMRRQGDGSYRVSSRGNREPVELPSAISIGEQFSIGPMTFQLQDSLASDPPSVIRISVDSFRRSMRSLRRRIQIQRSDIGSRLIEIQYRNPDPAVARQFVNRVAEDFVDFSLTWSQRDVRREETILSQEVDRIEKELLAAEAELEAFQTSELVVLPEEQATQEIGRVAEMQLIHDVAEVERSSLGAVVEELENSSPRAGAQTPFRALASFPTFISNEGVQELVLSLLALENERATLLVRRQATNEDVVALDLRIREIEEQLLDIANDYLQGLDNQIESTQSALDTFDQSLRSLPSLELQYTVLKRRQRILSELYVMLETRLADVEVRRAVDDAEVRIVDTGIEEDRPAFPRRSITAILAAMIGLLAGLFAVVGAESRYHRSSTEPQLG